jgi:hypothetical protein
MFAMKCAFCEPGSIQLQNRFDPIAAAAGSENISQARESVRLLRGRNQT